MPINRVNWLNKLLKWFMWFVKILSLVITFILHFFLLFVFVMFLVSYRHKKTIISFMFLFLVYSLIINQRKHVNVIYTNNVGPTPHPFSYVQPYKSTTTTTCLYWYPDYWSSGEQELRRTHNSDAFSRSRSSTGPPTSTQLLWAHKITQKTFDYWKHQLPQPPLKPPFLLLH